jgi:hypothetical protein
MVGMTDERTTADAYAAVRASARYQAHLGELRALTNGSSTRRLVRLDGGSGIARLAVLALHR